MFNQYKVSIFVPIFNEERILERGIKALDYAMGKFNFDYEIFIVNDASKDKTKVISETIQEKNNMIKLLNYENGPSRRENLAQSFKEGDGNIIVFVDIDFVSSFCLISDLINSIIEGYDIVTGSKYISGSKLKRKPYRLFTSFIYNTFVRYLFNTRIRDHLCGFKAFKRDVILRLIDEMGYDKSLRRGIFWDAELLIRARRHGYSIKEIPVRLIDRRKTNLFFQREIKNLFYIFDFMRRIKKEETINKYVSHRQ